MNIVELVDSLRDNTAALIVSEENRFYFTEFETSDGFLAVTKAGAIFITDSRYIEAAKQNVKDCRVILQDGALRQLNKYFVENNITEVMIEASRVSVLDAARYRDAFPNIKLNYTTELDKKIVALRAIKSSKEKDCILNAQRIAEAAFEKILHVIKPGVTERNVAAELEYLMRKGGADGVSFDTIVVAGKNSSRPHGVPSDTPIASGDFVTIDFGAIYKGYHSDTTRTVAVGNVSPEMANVYDIVLKAQCAGVKGLKAGITTKSADALCRDFISAAGFGNHFGHGTGHGVGVEIHESPSISPRSDEVLEVGNVVTVEPGIYLEEKFGVRIEDMLYITENGAENFVTLPKNLMVLT